MLALPLQVIMYDEPTAGLDPVASTVIEDLIRELHEKYGESQHHHQALQQQTLLQQQAGVGSGRAGSYSGAAVAFSQAAQQAEQAAVPGGITSYIVVTHQHSTIRRAGWHAFGRVLYTG
jgi:ABC-type phosphate transport system ATPase subunit